MQVRPSAGPWQRGTAVPRGPSFAQEGNGGTPPPTNVHQAAEFGLVNNTADQTTAFAAALNSLAAGHTLQVPAGWTIRHNDVITWSKTNTRLIGPGRLLAMNYERCGLLMRADNLTLENITVETVDTSNLPVSLDGVNYNPSRQTRTPGAFSQNITVDQVSGAILRDVTSINSSATGIRLYGASNYLLERCVVEHSWADGIHSTRGSHHGQIVDCVVRQNGDDMISVVSYNGDAVTCNHITITGCRGEYNYHGRGMTTVGGTDITFDNFQIETSKGAAIYVVAEDPTAWNTLGINRAIYRTGAITHANTQATSAQNPYVVRGTEATGLTYKTGQGVHIAAVPNHGAIMVVNQQPTALTDVQLRDITVTDTRVVAGGRNCRVDNSLPTTPNPVVPCNRVLFDNIDIVGGPTTNFANGNTPAGNWLQQNSTRDGVAIAAQGLLDPATVQNPTP